MIYSDYDIESEDNGDLVLQEGDLKMATASRSISQAVSFVILTDYGEYIPSPLTAANLGSFIGRSNTSQIAATHGKMRSNIKFGIDEQGVVQTTQMAISVTPIDIDQAAVIIRMPLITIERDPADNLEVPLTMGFIFPYLGGEIVKISMPDDQNT